MRRAREFLSQGAATALPERVRPTRELRGQDAGKDVDGATAMREEPEGSRAGRAERAKLGGESGLGAPGTCSPGESLVRRAVANAQPVEKTRLRRAGTCLHASPSCSRLAGNVSPFAGGVVAGSQITKPNLEGGQDVRRVAFPKARRRVAARFLVAPGFAFEAGGDGTMFLDQAGSSSCVYLASNGCIDCAVCTSA